VRPGSCADITQARQLGLTKLLADAPFEEMRESLCKTHSSWRTRVEHGIAHLKNRRALVRHHGRREHMSDTVQAVAGLLSRQQTTTLLGRPRV
jgi:hypothetical protein